MIEAEQARQTIMIIIFIYAFIITDMTETGTRKKCQQCLQVNIFTISAVLSIDIDDLIKYLYIKNMFEYLIQAVGHLHGGAEVSRCQMRGCWRAEQDNSPFCLLGLNRKMTSF
jgi:hypothetical protein